VPEPLPHLTELLAGNFHNDLVHLRVDTTFADVPRPDVLLVPGSPIAAQYAADGHAIVNWIREN
jgi:hypothetical protein